jgi:hypothetical protein
LLDLATMLAIYVEGETKTGKGAASAAIAKSLEDHGLQVYYDVAGDFFRRYVAIIRRQLELGEDGELPPTAELRAIATELYRNGGAFELDSDLGDLQRPAISQSVSILGELPIAQQAASDWFGMSLKQAHAVQADVLLLDGRNPRLHIDELVSELGLEARTILDIYMQCDADVAASRMAASDASSEQIQAASGNIIDRRRRDRLRPEWPFIEPTDSVSYTPGAQPAAKTVAATWQAPAVLPITLDNSVVSKAVLEQSLADLTVAALEYL